MLATLDSAIRGGLNCGCGDESVDALPATWMRSRATVYRRRSPVPPVEATRARLRALPHAMTADAPKIRISRTTAVRALAVTILLGVVAAAIVWAQGSSGRAFLRRSHISQPPTGYVQLYFRNPRSLPDYVVSKRAHAHLSFVLVNNEQSSRTLHWTISTQGYSPAARGRVRLAAGHSRVIGRTITVRCTRHRVHETVAMESPSESIGYWIACPSSTTKGH